MRTARIVNLVIALLLGLAVLACAGCTREDVDRAQATVTSLQGEYAKAQAALADARAALATAQTAATMLDSEKGKALIAKAQAAVDAAAKYAPDVQAALAVAKSAADAAAANYQTGQSTIATIGSILGGILTAAVPALAVITRQRTSVADLRTAVAVTADHAERMEAAQTDADVAAAKNISAMQQEAAGVAALIATIRGKT